MDWQRPDGAGKMSLRMRCGGTPVAPETIRTLLSGITPRCFQQWTVDGFSSIARASALGDPNSLLKSCGSIFMTASIADCNTRSQQPMLHFARLRGYCVLQDCAMAKKPKIKQRNNLKAWREFRQMTQVELGKAAKTTASVVSLLESGERGLSLKWLLKFAPALSTTPGMILDHDPNDLNTDVLEIWATIPADKRAQATAILQTFAKRSAG